ncbi:MAG: hypothetical protein SFY69_09435 [Planctomycetota bacterium]|nr:hypothetical protein [Planctomycetota bacterium]
MTFAPGQHRTRRRALLARLGLPGLVLLAGGCVETRVIRYEPFLGGLPGAQSNTPVRRDFGDYVDPAAIPVEQLEREVEPGKKVLVARSARHLMIHIHNTLDRGEKELFVEQVLSGATRAECAERGVDPGDAFDYLLTRRDDIASLFNLMPDGERTPGLYLRPIGGSAYRLQIKGVGATDLYWTGFDMVMEKGNYRLRWFVR